MRPAAKLTDIERRTYTPGAQYGLLILRGMDDADLLDVARDPDSSAYAEVLALMGSSTNRHWITATAAEVAYERGVMDERELDRIMGW